MTDNISLEGKKLLWVEDDNFLSDLVAKKLAAEKCVLFHASNGEEAVKIFETETPDVVLLDILLPGIDGFEILKKIRANEKTKNTPVIILSNLGQKTDLEKGKELGATKFLIKATVNLDEIVGEIKKTLG
ncbi:MAG: hypothetical protein A2836_01170 [Candidatus Taylorbacteria bacterium RIFCSPHIGHO2_01_FULL_45_63]|uniref:Response regulatory domain-containing protein n=1 Tax=Candidatus Taylorbacteria bacterium RIFCSPHIGHO2_02_FULL_45_35 TaxID=1802311 RepID=A0A1G2MND0_9BACT|nr:MAG: hypothetical protein A2836_01170 [Candidatus Taylorbacteria bacterium RIFCSPHIGHO2_01_FULL_45_63]OHA25367.1 MAG: hypothetical protein A3D56_04015 [Candidatus Taylorbacteria bacterium RIFCSPHIGHO2_02_FULL_45_35]OHA35089.1 MAG: hypothetical protein A3A22_03770 [Candidatus Taylorbacteria bacterium RIFCSPLOWO2_01_FULL_45_34b]